MHHHKEIKILDFTAEQLFSLVADVDSYDEFLPWCLASRIQKRAKTEDGEVLTADLIIGYKMIREKFTSKISLYPHHEIKVENLGGPFKYMKNNWIFKDLSRERCEVSFEVEFKFKSALLDKMMGLFFENAVNKMVGAFEKRAQEIYK